MYRLGVAEAVPLDAGPTQAESWNVTEIRSYGYSVCAAPLSCFSATWSLCFVTDVEMFFVALPNRKTLSAYSDNRNGWPDESL